MRKKLEYCGVQKYLLSYAVDGKHAMQFSHFKDVIIDSGAFSVWNKGGSIDIEAYRNFCLTLPQNWTFINLDVIPKTGSTGKEIMRCVDQGFENFKFLSEKIKNLMPVYHFGESHSVLRRIMDVSHYIGVSPANDVSEKQKRIWLHDAFSRIPLAVKTHGLGYSSFDGLRLFPFFSVDSISYKRVVVRGKPLLMNAAMETFLLGRIKEYLGMEKLVTELWKRRGVEWN